MDPTAGHEELHQAIEEAHEAVEEAQEAIKETVEEAESEIAKLTREIQAISALAGATHKEMAELANLVHRALDVLYIVIDRMAGEEPGEAGLEGDEKEALDPEELVEEAEKAPPKKRNTRYIGRR